MVRKYSLILMNGLFKGAVLPSFTHLKLILTLLLVSILTNLSVLKRNAERTSCQRAKRDPKAGVIPQFPVQAFIILPACKIYLIISM